MDNEKYMKHCYELAVQAGKKGFDTFGAVLVHNGEIIEETENTFQAGEAREKVKAFLKDILLPEGDLLFWKCFAEGQYRPELLFEDPEILEKIKAHPMAIWKCENNAGRSRPRVINGE